MIKVGAALLVLCAGATAQESQLASLRQTLLSLRQYAGSNSSARGGLPELTTAKHQLREWIESRLASFPQDGDEGALSNGLLDAIQKALLFCDDPSDCTPNPLGFVDQIQIRREHGQLVITTAVGTGIRCGYDYSAYIYAWQGERWRRIWENEQNDYSEKAYHPQTLHSVHVSDAAGEGARLILTLGTPAGCTGAFVPLYYRLWRISPQTAVASLILDKSETLDDESEPQPVYVRHFVPAISTPLCSTPQSIH